MNWVSQVIFYMGLFDAAVVMIVGLVAAARYLLGYEMGELSKRVIPAVGILVGTNIGAGIILWAVTKLVAA